MLLTKGVQQVMVRPSWIKAFRGLSCQLQSQCTVLPNVNTARQAPCAVVTPTWMRPNSTLLSSPHVLYGNCGFFSSLRCFCTTNPPNDDSMSIRSVITPPAHDQESASTTPSSLRQAQSGKTTIIEPPIRSRPFRHYRGPAANLRRLAPTTKRVVVNQIYQATRPGNEYGSYPVKAVHAAQSIDLAKVIANVFLAKSERRMMERHSVVVQLRPTATGDNQASRFIAVFDFGSVVLFNVAPREEVELLREIKQFASGPVLSGSERKEKFCVHVQPDAGDGSIHDGESEDVVTADYCVVQELNMKAVDVISNVMAQSVALDSYNDTVDELLDQFESINKKVMSGEGGLTTSDRDKMFRTVAQNNGIFIEMVSKVGIKDRIDTAWVMSQYENISEGMREEFDIDQRFEHIEFKLNLIQQNAKFFLEILAHQKSNMLEWIIIVLISFECVLMCMEMSGVGGIVFGYLGSSNVPPPP